MRLTPFDRPGPARRRVAFGLLVVLPALALPASVKAAGCVIDPTPCNGCGCKGGPGYRHVAPRKCVGFRELAKKCGDPPGAACVFENAPGTGANRECALSGKGKPAS